MRDIFHVVDNLDRALEEGLKAPYQLELERPGSSYLSLEQMNNPSTPAITKFLVRTLLFSEDIPQHLNWVSILIDDNDASIKVGNTALRIQPYEPGDLYQKSIMSLPENLKQRSMPVKSRQDFENPFTARMMDYDQEERFRQRWGSVLEKELGEPAVYQYIPEIIVPRLVIEPTEFNRVFRC